MIHTSPEIIHELGHDVVTTLDPISDRAATVLSIEKVLSNQPSLVGLVDDMLSVCAAHQIELVFQQGSCEVRALDGSWMEVVPWPIPRSGFRAVIARVAALCNEQSLQEVSPYGGESELTVSTRPGALLKATFVNTPDQQQLTLSTLNTGNCPSGTRRILTAEGIAITIVPLGTNKVGITIEAPMGMEIV